MGGEFGEYPDSRHTPSWVQPFRLCSSTAYTTQCCSLARHYSAPLAPLSASVCPVAVSGNNSQLHLHKHTPMHAYWFSSPYINVYQASLLEHDNALYACLTNLCITKPRAWPCRSCHGVPSRDCRPTLSAPHWLTGLRLTGCRGGHWHPGGHLRHQHRACRYVPGRDCRNRCSTQTRSFFVLQTYRKLCVHVRLCSKEGHYRPHMLLLLLYAAPHM